MIFTLFPSQVFALTVNNLITQRILTSVMHFLEKVASIGLQPLCWQALNCRPSLVGLPDGHLCISVSLFPCSLPQSGRRTWAQVGLAFGSRAWQSRSREFRCRVKRPCSLISSCIAFWSKNGPCVSVLEINDPREGIIPSFFEEGFKKLFML